MDWTLAIERNRRALMRLVGVLFAMAGISAGGSVAVLPRMVRSKVLNMLRPAEAATRRLAVILAREIVVALRGKRPAPTGEIARGSGERAAAFALIDPRKRFGFSTVTRKVAPGLGPRFTVIDVDEWVAEPVPEPKSAATPDDPMDAKRMCRRLQALHLALCDLPKLARRLARHQARMRAKAEASGRMNFKPAMRGGRPPGHRAKGRSEIDEILQDCHTLALMALAEYDTS